MTKDLKERYSFSRLSSFLTCKHGFYLRYVDNEKGIGNCFSSYGTFLHSILERYSSGELNLWDLAEVYEREFNKSVTEPFPNTKFCADMRQLYFEQGLDFFQNFHGHPNAKILEVESEFDFDIDDWTFNGVIDLAFEDEAGRLIIEDYKSKGIFKNKQEQQKYARQLYLYALYIKKKYGRYPDILRFMLVRKQKEIDIPFRESCLEEALNWARETVKAIRECFDFGPTPEEFFCSELCNHRETCEYKPHPN